MADTLVAGIAFPVPQSAATYFNSLPADEQARIRAAPVAAQRAYFNYFKLLSEQIGDKTYQDSQQHQREMLGPFDFSGTPLAAPAETVNKTVSAAGTAGDILGSLSQPATWIRIAQAVIGGGLIIVALAVIARPVKGALP